MNVMAFCLGRLALPNLQVCLLAWALAWAPGFAGEAGLAKAQAAEPETLAAAEIVVRDVLGREVAIRQPVRRIVLEESRQLYAVAMLEREAPLARIVGWGGDLQQADPDTYGEYQAVFPEIDRIPMLGSFASASFNLEKAVALAPDVVFLNLESERIAQDAAYVERLAMFGIPVVYVDFRHHPERNAEASMALFGQILGRDERAREFSEFRRSELARVTDKLAEAKPARPTVFIERMAGLTEDCCYSFGKENFGRYVDLAGGINVAEPWIPGTFGQVNPEQVIAADPAHVIVTSADWHAFNQSGGWVPVGPGADPERSLQALAQYPLKAVYRGGHAAAQGNFHAAWHQFYNSPYDFIAVQQIARWLHPELFPQLDPEDTFRRLHQRFLPVSYQAGYFATLAGHP